MGNNQTAIGMWVNTVRPHDMVIIPVLGFGFFHYIQNQVMQIDKDTLILLGNFTGSFGQYFKRLVKGMSIQAVSRFVGAGIHCGRSTDEDGLDAVFFIGVDHALQAVFEPFDGVLCDLFVS